MTAWRAILAVASRAARSSSTTQKTAAAGACAAAAAAASASTAASLAHRSGSVLSGAHRGFYAAAVCAAAAASLAFPASTAHASAPASPSSASALPRSFIMVKPDGVHRGLVSAVVERFERRGYKLVGIKVIVPTAAMAEAHYEEHKGKPFFPKLVDFLSSGPVVAMAWEGEGVVKAGRAMIGATNPQASAPGTIRGDFGVSTGRNLVHGSDSDESAAREIALWFREGELASYEAHSAKWVYE